MTHKQSVPFCIISQSLFVWQVGLLSRSILSYRYTTRHYRNGIDMPTTVTIQRKSRIKIHIMTDISIHLSFIKLILNGVNEQQQKYYVNCWQSGAREHSGSTLKAKTKLQTVHGWWLVHLELASFVSTNCVPSFKIFLCMYIWRHIARFHIRT